MCRHRNLLIKVICSASFDGKTVSPFLTGASFKIYAFFVAKMAYYLKMLKVLKWYEPDFVLSDPRDDFSAKKTSADARLHFSIQISLDTGPLNKRRKHSK